MFTTRTIKIIAAVTIALAATHVAHADIMTYKGLGLRKSVNVHELFAMCRNS